MNKNELPVNALLMELCWEPIHDYFDRQRISYFARFSNLLNTRLCKLIYKELICKNVKEWPLFSHINEVFKNIGLYHYFYWNYDKQNFNIFFGQISRLKQFEVIIFKKSLKIPKGQSESGYRRRTDNTLAKRKKYKRTNNDQQNIHIKLKIELHELYYNPGNDPSYKQLRVVFSIKISKG